MANIQPKLIVVSDQENDGPFFIDPRVDELTIGRSEDNHICLPGADVSGRHCRLLQRHGQWFVEDLGSAAGTRINGTPVTGEARIDDVDKLEVGSYTLQFLLEEPPEPPRPMRAHRPRSNVLQIPSHQVSPDDPGSAQAQSWPAAPAHGAMGPGPRAGAMGPLPPRPGMGPPPHYPVGPGPGPPPPGMGPGAELPGRVGPGPLPPIGPGPLPPIGPGPLPPGGPGGRGAGAAPASKICKCGLLLMGDAGGFSCPVCKRKYDRAGQEMGAKSATGDARGLGGFLTGRTGLCVIGGVVVLAVLVVLIVIVFSDDPARPASNSSTTPAKEEKLPKLTSDMLNVVVSGAIKRDAMDKYATSKPEEMTAKGGEELSVTIEKQSHPFRVVKNLKVKLAWTDVMVEVTSDLTGLSLQALRKIPVGTGSFEQDDVLERKADGWYITRAKR